MTAPALAHHYYVTYRYRHATGTIYGALNMAREFPIRDIADVKSIQDYIEGETLTDRPRPIGEGVMVSGWFRYDAPVEVNHARRPSVDPARRDSRCTAAHGCPVHPGINGIHPPWGLADPVEVFDELNMLNGALERAIGDSWDGDDSWSSIATGWIEHMALVHGVHCPGRHCAATPGAVTYVAALRRMWVDTERYGARPDHPFTATYRDAIRDLAHELGVDLDG